MSEDSIQLLTSKMTRHKLAKRHVLIEAGTVDKNYYFIES